jgi:hypothetical protein
VDDALLEERWHRAQEWLRGRFDREPGIEAMLFLIGIQSRGRGFEPELDKDQKQDTIMEGTFCAFERLGFYERVGLDENGFWIWERIVHEIPKLSVEDQEKLLKLGILSYFDDAIRQKSSN